jgi:hypothetical protein
MSHDCAIVTMANAAVPWSSPIDPLHKQVLSLLKVLAAACWVAATRP